MIKEATYYTLDCDNCGEQFIDSHSGFAAMHEPSSIQELADSSGWHSGDGEQGEEDKHYCPACFKIDDDDNFILILH